MKTILAIAISLSLAAPITWASNNVFANGKEISAKRGAGKSIAAFPDVLVSPPQLPATPPGVPIPYPNIGKASDMSKGAKKVKESGKEASPKKPHQFQRQAPRGVPVDPKRLNQGKTYFTPYSFDVKFEDKEHFDPGPFCHHR